jgi:hypothetical protein
MAETIIHSEMRDGFEGKPGGGVHLAPRVKVQGGVVTGQSSGVVGTDGLFTWQRRLHEAALCEATFSGRSLWRAGDAHDHGPGPGGRYVAYLTVDSPGYQLRVLMLFPSVVITRPRASHHQ